MSMVDPSPNSERSSTNQDSDEEASMPMLAVERADGEVQRTRSMMDGISLYQLDARRPPDLSHSTWIHNLQINGGTTTVGLTTEDNPGPPTQWFKDVKVSKGSNVIFGSVTNYHAGALFGGLRVLSPVINDDAMIKYLNSRSFIESTDEVLLPVYLPHVQVDDPELSRSLNGIAAVCRFFDAAFAEYFRLVIGPLQSTKTQLARIREQICSQQQPDKDHYIGPFGEYCERLSAIPGGGIETRTERYQHHAFGNAIQPYLQDALEVPYWKMMAKQFVKSKEDNDPFTYETVLIVIDKKLRSLTVRLEQLKQQFPEALPSEIEYGISCRIKVLEGILEQPLDDASQEEQAPSADDLSDLEKISLLTLFLVFTGASMVPFAIGFAGNLYAETSEAVGSTSDPDFKWLIASTMLAIFGNIYAMVPLWKMTRGSPASIISQVFLYFSIALGIFSVSVYPFWNKACSASLSFFCSFFAIGSVFVSARHTSQTTIRRLQVTHKKKND